MTRGESVIKFIESYCVVPEGDLIGKPVRLAEFQKKFILEVYDNEHVTDTAILSIARKNAKTGTIAFILLAHLVGPEAVQNSRIVSGARSRDQAAEVYNLASKCVQLSEKLSGLIRIIPSSKKLIGLPMNVEYQAISAEGKTAHGKSPILAILDEVGQIQGPQDDFIDAITTAQGAYSNPLLVYISTQAANDGDFFSIQIDDAKTYKPKKTVCHVYCADSDGEVLDPEQWKKANPALGLFRSEKDVRKQAEKAARMPSFENTFRNLVMNQRVSLVSPFISKTVWEQNNSNHSFCEDAGIYGGLDLSSRTDFTSLVLISPLDNDKISVESYFWMPEDAVFDRAHEDRQPYDVWVKEGYIRTCAGKTVDYEYVIKDIVDILDGRDLTLLGFDRWRIDVFKKELERLGLDWEMAEFGQGYKDMSPAMDEVEADLLNGRICHGDNPVLTMCAANAVVTKDPAGNRKLDKHKASGRIDGMVALTMARGVLNFEQNNALPPSPWEDESFSIA
tara:strand:+ start:536 stop:2053 length:1518 start_codon:yes stop_codon:yes gene_type:complete